LSSATLLATAGQITVLLGRNGAGKSTLLKIAAGWMRPDYGIVIFKGERYTRPRLAELALEGLFYLPERSLLCPTLTLREHLHALASRFPHVAQELGNVLRLLRLEALADHKPRDLSGGERRRAEVAIAFARRPDCLLADEPFQGIAPTDTEMLYQCFSDLASRGTAVVISGHEVPVLLELGHQVVWQTAGTTHFLGAPANARKNYQFVREYLGAAPA
jgi:ABC-type multidrug transport system ATPase subunit